MFEYLSTCNRFFLPRKLRFRETFQLNLSSIVEIQTMEILDRSIKDFGMAQRLNTFLGLFLRDALALLDRGFIFLQIKKYNDKMIEKIK